MNVKLHRSVIKCHERVLRMEIREDARIVNYT